MLDDSLAMLWKKKQDEWCEQVAPNDCPFGAKANTVRSPLHSLLTEYPVTQPTIYNAGSERHTQRLVPRKVNLESIIILFLQRR